MVRINIQKIVFYTFLKLFNKYKEYNKIILVNYRLTMKNNNLDLIKKLKKYNFYHSIKLNDEITTNGIQRLERVVHNILKELRKINFKNKRVLDVGARDCIYSFEAEKLGAKEIVAIDNDVSLPAKKFLIPFFNSKVKLYEKNLFQLTQKEFGKFDIIIFPGVLYHLRCPFDALKILTSLLKDNGQILIETATYNNNGLPMLYCPTFDSPYDGTSCTFFNEKGLQETLMSFGVNPIRTTTLDPRRIVTLIKNVLRFFFGRSLFGKRIMIPITRSIFIGKKNRKLNKRIENYWFKTHTEHSNMFKKKRTRIKEI